jgi:CHAT domain-containing protein
MANQGKILKFLPSLSGKDQEHLLENEESKFQICQSFCVKAGSSLPELRGELYNQQLFFKGLLLNTSARWKQRVKTSGDLKLIRRYDEWANLQHKISNLFTSTDSTDRNGLDSLVQKAEKLEKELSQRSENFVRSEERKVRTWQEVQKSIKPGEVAIELVRVRKFGITKTLTDTSDPKKPNYRIKGLTDTVQYAALIVTKTCTQPELVLMTNGNDLEGKWYEYYSNSIRLRNNDKNSYRQFWEPISRKLKGIKKVWFSADGVYHKINPGTLKNPITGKYLSEEIELSLLGSTKDLLKVFPDESENRLACLIGNPDFQPGLLASSGKSRSGPEMSYFYKPNPNLEISALPGTQTEVDSIASLLKREGWEVQSFSGAEASEDKVKDSYKPRVMLLSTHGFFQPDTTPGNNPLIRSGLLLTGAAKTLHEGRSDSDGEDGILTSYEAMNLNLDNTELVVLSACETGLGEIKNGEGVYGLQRAFQVAGARNLIMSLWKVNDIVTQQLMVSFFKHWLNGKSKHAAFAQAQKEIRAKYPAPYYWGGFVLLGK